MPDLKNLFRKASLTLVDGLLLALCAAALAYLSVPFLAKWGIALGNAGEPNKGADIKIVSVIVFLGVFLLGVLAVFCAAFVTECIILAMLPNRARLVTRIGLVVVFLPVFVETARRGPRGYVDWLINPSIRENEAKQTAKSELERKLKASGALSVEREPDGIKITNNTDQLVRVQVAFITRSNQMIYQCYPGQSATLPPSPSDEEMNLPPREARLFLFSEAHTNTGSRRECGFDDYAVWGWDEKSVPMFLSQKAHLF
ncbi:MAG: hypothetical protein WBC04_25135 [Candidatus Acidiferrales bacterium]